MSFEAEMRRYHGKGFRIIDSTIEGATMVKPKRVSIAWLLGTGVIPYLIYHVLFKSERSVFLEREGPDAA